MTEVRFWPLPRVPTAPQHVRDFPPEFRIGGDEIEVINKLVYLGSLVTADNDTTRETQRRILSSTRWKAICVAFADYVVGYLHPCNEYNGDDFYVEKSTLRPKPEWYGSISNFMKRIFKACRVNPQLVWICEATLTNQVELP